MKAFRRLLAVLAWGFAASLCLAAPVSAQAVDRIVAVVNGEVITLKQLNSRVNSLMKSQKIGAANKSEVQRKVLDALIEQELINQAAKLKGVFVTDSDVSDAIEMIKRDNNINEAQLRASLAASGTSLEAFREDLRVELLRNRVLGANVMSKVVVTDKEVVAFLSGNGPEGLQQGSSSGSALRMIALPAPKGGNKSKIMAEAKKIKKEIEDGLSFSEAAFKYSKGPGFENGGDPGDNLPFEALPPPVKEMLLSLKPGQPSDPVDAGSAILILTMADQKAAAPKKEKKSKKNTASISDYSPEQIENARRQLEMHKMQQSYMKWVTDLKRSATIRVNL